MTLQFQDIELTIAGGLSQNEDAILTQRPTQMLNCLERKTGAISKRYGYEAIASLNRRLDGTTPATPELLCTYGNELVRIGGGAIDTYQDVSVTSDWVARGLTPECIAQVANIATTGGTSGYTSNPDVAVCGAYSITAYATDAAPFNITVDIVNIATGSVIVSQFLVATSPTNPLLCPRVRVSGATVGVFWTDYTGAKISGRFFSTLTMTWGTVGTVGNSVLTNAATSGNYDVQALDATHWVVATEATAGLGLMTWSFDTTFTLTAGTTFATGTPVNLTAVSIRAIAGERVWVSYGTFSGSTYSVKMSTFTTALANESGPYTITTSTPAGFVAHCGVERISATRVIVVWNAVQSSTVQTSAWWDEVTLSGTTLAAVWGGRHAATAMFLARPIIVGARAYALACNLHSQACTHFLLDLAAGAAMATGATARIVAVALPRQIAGQLGPTNLPRIAGLSDCGAVTTGIYLAATSVITGQGGQESVIGLQFSFSGQWKRGTRETLDTLAIAGGAVSAYDGRKAFELGFAYEPDVAGLPALVGSNSTGNIGGGTGGVALATYNYICVYEFNDARGNVYRSIPSLSQSLKMTSGQNTIVGYVPSLNLTNKVEGSANGSQVSISLYRTAGNGSTYYYLLTVPNVPNTAGGISWTDGEPDFTLIANRELYTTGGVLDNVIPASASIVHTHQQALFLAGTDDDTIWISKAFVDGDGTAFNDELVIAPFDGGRVTALATLGGELIIFKADTIWLVSGTPPNDLGASTLSPPQKIPSDVGCIDPSSVVETVDGIMFYAKTGICLLNRALAVVPVGKQIENSYSGGFAGATLVPGQNLVRMIQSGATSNHSLNYDYFHSTMRQSPAWSIDTWTDPVTGSAAQAASCCMWSGAFTWISTSGYVYQEYGAFIDSGAGNQNWVPMAFTTAVEKARGPQGFNRIRRVSALMANGSPHGLAVTLASDVGSETATWSAAAVAAIVAADPTGAEQVQVHSQYQKVQWMSVTIADTDPGTRGTGAGVTLRSVSVNVGAKTGAKRLPAANRQ